MKLRTTSVLPTLLLLVMSFCAVPGVPAQDENGNEGEAIAFFNQGQDAHEKGDLKAAIGLYEKAIKLLPEFPEAELQRGRAFVSLGDLATAETAFRRAVALREDWSLALADLGSLLVRRGKFDEARTTLKKAIEVDADSTPAYVGMSWLLVKTKASEAELREMHKKISFMASSAMPISSVWASKAILENALDDKRAAVNSAGKALEIDPKNISMLAFLASVSLENNDPAKAADSIKRIEAAEPTAEELPALKTRLLVANNKVDEALKLIESVPNPGADLLELKSKIVAARTVDIPTLEKQLAAEPKNVVALSRLCSLLRTTEPLRAMEFCRRASEIEPNNIEHAIGYGAAMLQAKQYLPAVGLFQKLTAAAPENFTVRANLATALFQLKRYNEAKVQFTWLVEKQPSNVAAYFFLAISHDELREYGDAMANYQAFLRLADPKLNQLEIDKVNLRLPTLQKQLDTGKGQKGAKKKS
ncbi:MAG: hypothetical protein DMF62_04340 [Acidobacteria bacterium]|nr:MAG: hypothetical protein DMF62_04340 [Acidobacteriota bacterium]